MRVTNQELNKKKSNPMEEDIYEMYMDGPYDWLNPIDIFTNLLTNGPAGDWTVKSHTEKIYEISKQYPNLTKSDIEVIIAKQKGLRGK